MPSLVHRLTQMYKLSNDMLEWCMGSAIHFFFQQWSILFLKLFDLAKKYKNDETSRNFSFPHLTLIRHETTTHEAIKWSFSKPTAETRMKTIEGALYYSCMRVSMQNMRKTLNGRPTSVGS